MSTLYGVNYTLYNTGVNGPTEANIAARGGAGGELCVLFDTYEASSTTATDVVYWGPGPLNKGDIVIGYILSSDNVGSTGTVDIGTVYNDDQFASAIDISGQAVSGNTACLVDGMGYTIGTTATDEIIQLTLNTAAMTGTIKCAILYIKY